MRYEVRETKNGKTEIRHDLSTDEEWKARAYAENSAQWRRSGIVEVWDTKENKKIWTNEKEVVKVKMKEFIDCPADNCNCKMKWDEDDMEYSCNACAITVRVQIPSDYEDTKDVLIQNIYVPS
jgi:hypothetical protein